MPLTQSFPSGSILLVRFPAQSCIVLYGNISQAMGLVAGNGLLRHHKTVLRNRYNRSFGIVDVVFPYRRRCSDYPMSAYRTVPTPCQRDSSPCGRGLRGQSASPSPRHVYCPDDPSGNSAPPSSCRCSYRRSDRRRTRRFRMSRHYVPKNLHNEWIRCRRVRAPRSLYRRKVRYNTTPIPVNMNRRQIN